MTMISRPSARRSLVAAALAVAGLLVAGCGSQAAGAAATIGDTRISEQQLTTEVQDVLRAQGKPLDATDQELTAQTLSRMITRELVATLADRNAVVVTRGDLDQQLATYEAQAGTREEFERSLAEQGVAPSQIEGMIMLNLQAQAIGIALNPNGTAEEQGQTVFEAVGALSDELEATASPRFGTWDASSISVGPVPTDLAAPPALG